MCQVLDFSAARAKQRPPPRSRRRKTIKTFLHFSEEMELPSTGIWEKLYMGNEATCRGGLCGLCRLCLHSPRLQLSPRAQSSPHLPAQTGKEVLRHPPALFPCCLWVIMLSEHSEACPRTDTEESTWTRFLLPMATRKALMR
jgi:hypothetical protein